MDALAWALRALRAYERRISALGVLSTVEVGLRVLLPWPMKAVVDHALGAVAPPAWLLALPGAAHSRAGLLGLIVLLGLLLQLGHQAVLTIHSRLRPGAERARQLESRMSARMQESFAAIRLVKSFGREPYEGQRFSGAATEAMKARVGLSTREALFSSMAVVLSGSIRENLRYGRLDATDEDEEIEAAARTANAHDFIMALERGYDTELAELGGGLSGGQRQRLSIARAFVKDAPILVLDEPTAALDSISERLVFGAVRRLRQGRTMFVIAHRLATVRQADRILVLSGGRIVADGTHEALVRGSALYRELAAEMTEGGT